METSPSAPVTNVNGLPSSNPRCPSMSFSDFSDDDFHYDSATASAADAQPELLVPLLSHRGLNALTCREGDFHCPSVEEVNRQINLFEKQREEFNEMQLKYSTTEDSADWDRRKLLLSLAHRLKKMGVTMAESMAFRTSLPVMSASGWIGSETDAQQYELCHQSNGLSVWKKEFGSNRVIVRSEFLVPLTPKQYCEYASNIEFRREWDSNVSEARKIEQIAEGIDIAYVAINPIATIYPRDYVNIRVIHELKSFGRPHRHRINLAKRHSKTVKPPVKHEGHEGGKCEDVEMNNNRGVGMGVDACNGVEHMQQQEQLQQNGIEPQQGGQQNGITQQQGEDQQQNGIEQQGGKDVKAEGAQEVGALKVHDKGRSSHHPHHAETLHVHHHHHHAVKKAKAHASRAGCYASCSCSIEHPRMPEQTGKVRADVKIGCYLAQSIYLPNRERRGSEKSQGTSDSTARQSAADASPIESSSAVWSRVYMFSEVDPRGWIPGVMSKYIAARILPSTVDRIISCMLDHYKTRWRTELVYHPELKIWKFCENALEYCFLKYLFAIGESEGRTAADAAV